jgi:hypothetical protein
MLSSLFHEEGLSLSNIFEEANKIFECDGIATEDVDDCDMSVLSFSPPELKAEEPHIEESKSKDTTDNDAFSPPGPEVKIHDEVKEVLTATGRKEVKAKGSSKAKPPKKQKKEKKRQWRKPEGKPKRPLSAYNLFFQLERERIVNGEPEKVFTADDVAKIVIVEKDDKKRKHTKTHGKITFANLARTIGSKWKKLDEEARAIFSARAEQEKERYKKELDEWCFKPKGKGYSNDDPEPVFSSKTEKPPYSVVIEKATPAKARRNVQPDTSKSLNDLLSKWENFTEPAREGTSVGA